jgi:hypothetical protein
MKKLFLILLIIIINPINAQELSTAQLDSLYRSLTFLRGVDTSDKPQKQIEIDPAIRKCGMGLVEGIKSNLSYFSVEQQSVLAKLLQRRDDLPKTLITPNGFFKIHYTDIGGDAIGYDVNLLAQALDSAYSFEVNYLGYPPPPLDGSAGGDDKYDVYVHQLLDYGSTSSESKVGVSSWTSFIEIDNDFGSIFYTHGIDAAQITVAHEFHHAIQMGNYAPENNASAIRGSDTFFYEISSTAMEEFVFDSVNDYYDYIPHYFDNTSKPFSTNPTQTELQGYGLAIWNIYLKDIFGFEIIKRQWELMKSTRAMAAIAFSINEYGSTFGHELNRFGIWTYYTSSRSVPGKFFKDASNYPLVKPIANTSFNPPSQQFTIGTSPSSNYFLDIKDGITGDSLMLIVTNFDFQNAINNQTQMFNASYYIYTDLNIGERKLGNYYSSSLTATPLTFWQATEIINGVVVNGDTTSIIPLPSNLSYAFPSPFYYFKNYSFGSFISIPIKASLGGNIELSIYTVSMDLVYSGSETIKFLANTATGIVWDVHDNAGEKLPTGVYIYVAKVGDEVQKGKLVIFNE